LSVGFKTQAHFTTVFRHFVGYPPRRWRMLRDEAAICQAA
jgi:AraC-like DNA-binding protein